MKMTKTLAVIATVALLGTASVTAYAADNTANNHSKERTQMTSEQKAEMQSKMEERLAQELEDGKITQEQYDEMISGFENGEMPNFGRHGFKGKMSDLTDEEKAEMQSKMEERLAQELEDGKITQEQYDEMISGFENGEMPNFGRHGFKGEISDLTDEEKAETQSKMEDRLAQALEDGKITQEQYDEMISDFENGEMPYFGRHGFKGKMPNLDDK